MSRVQVEGPLIATIDTTTILGRIEFIYRCMYVFKLMQMRFLFFAGSKSNRSQIVIIIVVPIVVSVVLIVIFFCICLRVRRTKKKLETGKLIQGKDATLVNIN